MGGLSSCTKSTKYPAKLNDRGCPIICIDLGVLSWYPSHPHGSSPRIAEAHVSDLVNASPLPECPLPATPNTGVASKKSRQTTWRLTGRRQRKRDRMLMKTTGRPALGVAMSAPTTYPRGEFTGTGMNAQFAVLVAPAIGAAACAAVPVTRARLPAAPCNSADHCRDEPEGLS